MRGTLLIFGGDDLECYIDTRQGRIFDLSTGIKAEGEGEWNARKHVGPKRRIWRKIHIGIDEETLEVRAVHCPTGDLHGKSAERGGHGKQCRRCARLT
ncbi:probable transposase for transposon [Citreicella sp. SE45]|nr:probable transposase for transposon [Citreicella sp. SE45]